MGDIMNPNTWRRHATVIALSIFVSNLSGCYSWHGLENGTWAWEWRTYERQHCLVDSHKSYIYRETANNGARVVSHFQHDNYGYILLSVLIDIPILLLQIPLDFILDTIILPLTISMETSYQGNCKQWKVEQCQYDAAYPGCA